MVSVCLRNVWFTRDASAAEDQRLLASPLQRSFFGVGPQATWHEEDERLTRSLWSLKLPKRGHAFGRKGGVRGVLRALKTETQGVAVRRAGLMLAAFQRQVKRCSERSLFFSDPISRLAVIALSTSVFHPPCWTFPCPERCCGSCLVRMIRLRERQVAKRLRGWHEHGRSAS